MTTLFENKWLSLKSVYIDGYGDYIYSHETRCNGREYSLL